MKQKNYNRKIKKIVICISTIYGKEIDFINVNPQMGGGKIKYNKTKDIKVYPKNINKFI